MNDISELLMMMGKIAGLSGLTIGVFFLLFKNVIQKNIYTKLGQNNTYKIIRLFLILVWSIAFIGLLTWFSLSLLKKENSEKQTESKVTVNADVIKGENVFLGNNNSINNNISMPSSGVDVYAKFINPLADENKNYFNLNSWIPEYEENEKNEVYPLLDVGFGDTKKNNYFLDDEVNIKDQMAYNFVRYYIDSKPVYEIRVVNNTNKSISIEKVLLNVENSQPYKKPLVIFLTYEWDLGYILFKNEGNSGIKNVKLSFNLDNTPLKNVEKYKYTVNTNPVKYHHYNTVYNRIDLSESLESEGIDISFLRGTVENYDSDEKFLYPHLAREETQKALGRYSSQVSPTEWLKPYPSFPQFKAYIQGSYEITGNYHGEELVKKGYFNGSIPLTAIPFHALGDIDTSVYKNSVLLKQEESNYQIQIGMSKYIKPFEVERYLFFLDAPETSEHIRNNFVNFRLDSCNSESSLRKLPKLIYARS